MGNGNWSGPILSSRTHGERGAYNGGLGGSAQRVPGQSLWSGGETLPLKLKAYLPRPIKVRKFTPFTVYVTQSSKFATCNCDVFAQKNAAATAG